MFQNSDEVSSQEPLYSKIQRFYIRNSSSEERQRDLRITVDLINTVSNISKQLLHIYVSDDEDPYFYYSLVLTNDDYQRLKNLQSLLVDFDNFPAQVIRLLEYCKQNESYDSKFHLLLEEEHKNDLKKTFLKIVETNNFKHLCHLVLQIEVGNDSDIKKLMLKKIKTLKEQNCKAEKLISDLENELLNKSKQLDSTQNELALVQQQWREDKISFKAESSREITEETERLRKIQLDWQIKAQREKSDLEERYLSSMKEKDSELSRFRVENQILLEKRTSAEVTITDQARRIDNLEKELVATRADLTSTSKLKAKLESDLHEKERSVNNLKTRLAVAEQESKDKNILTNKLQELLNNTNEQKSRLEEAVSEKEKHLQRKQLAIQNISDELIKANEIITKLQKDLSAISSKLSIRTSIALEQERVVEGHLKKISKLEEENSLKEKKISTFKENEKTLKKTVNEMKELMEVKEKKIKDNERVIDWLNRRISEQNKLAHDVAKPSSTQAALITASTPYGQFRTGESSTPRVPFSLVNTGVSAIQRLEQLQTLPTVEEQSHIRDENSPNKSPLEVPQDASPAAELSAEVSQKNSTQENSKKNSTKKVPQKKNTASIGFRRVTPTHTTPVPSSYFLQ